MISQHLALFTDTMVVSTDPGGVPDTVRLSLVVDNYPLTVRHAITLSLEQARDIIEALTMAVECAGSPEMPRDCESVEV